MKNNFKPRSKFERWIRDFGGTLKVSKILGVNQSSVQHWCAGRARPGVGHCSKIIELAKGQLTLKDIADGTKP